MWLREVLLSPCPAHRVPPAVTVLVPAAEAQPAPAELHQENEAPAGHKESHGGAPLARHVEQQPTGGVQLHLQGEMGPAGTGSDGSTGSLAAARHTCFQATIPGPGLHGVGTGPGSPPPKGGWDLIKLPAAARGPPEAEGAPGCPGLGVQLAQPVLVVAAALGRWLARHLHSVHQGME